MGKKTNILKLLHFFMLCRTYHGIIIFKFEPSTSTNETHSYAKLEGPENSKLPDNFVLCTSHFETSLDGNSFFTIFGEDGQPWISLPIYSTEGYPVLWVRQAMSKWIRIMEIEQVWLNFWIHICMQVNVQSGNLSVSLNGEKPVVNSIKEIGLQKPNFITDKLVLGLSNQGRPGDPRQFVGSVANVKLFEDDRKQNIQDMSKNLCVQWGGIIETNSKWHKHGVVKENNAEIWEVCYEKQTYRVVIPTPMDLIQGLEICRKLGSGNMTELKNIEDLEYTLTLFENQNSACDYIWTPLTDEEEEGKFKNIETGYLASYLPWNSGNPDGFTKQNNVVLELVSKEYKDLSGTWTNTCNACDLPINTTFSLLGICKDTFLGKIVILFLFLKCLIITRFPILVEKQKRKIAVQWNANLYLVDISYFCVLKMMTC